MGIVLAAFVLGMILIGFTMLSLLPLIFVWLAVAVYSEPWETALPRGSLPDLDADTSKPAEIAPPAPEVERPRTMAAGRRPSL